MCWMRSEELVDFPPRRSSRLALPPPMPAYLSLQIGRMDKRRFDDRLCVRTMFRIGKLFHVTQVVSDLDVVDKWYDSVFAVTRFYHGYAKAAGREASLIAIGEVIMEPMTPARVDNLRNQSVKKFHDRFGQHLHSIAWYVDDVQEISVHLEQHRLRLFDVTGRPVMPPKEKFAVWTHPKETHGQLEFAVIGSNTIDPRLQPAWSNEFWRERHPLGIEHASHITAVVKDVSVAKRFYCEVLGAKLIDERSTPIASKARSSRSAKIP